MLRIQARVENRVAPNPPYRRSQPPALIDHPASSSRPAAFRFEIASRSASDANAPLDDACSRSGNSHILSNHAFCPLRPFAGQERGAELKLGTRPFDCAEAALRSTEPTSIDGPESDIAEVYQRLEARGLEYKGAFRAMRRLVEGNRVAEARLESPSDAEQIRIIHPVTLDAAFQVLAALDDEAGTESRYESSAFG